jgi:hypothetical protein
MNHRNPTYHAAKTAIIYLCMASLMVISMLLPLLFSNQSAF